MPEYQAVRSKVPFLDLCKDPDLATEVTVTAAERLGVDAAILFADILLILEPMGLDLEFTKGEGPAIHNPVRTAADVDRVRPMTDLAPLGYVFEAVRRIRAALDRATPLIGFAGAPFTLASYVVEGGPSRNHERTKALMRRAPEVWHGLMDRLAELTATFLRAQVAAGVDAVQLFDSWAGALSERDYREYALPYSTRVLGGLADAGVPRIHFGVGTGELLAAMAEAGADVVGVDWRVPLDEAARRVGGTRAVQGNLDPAVLFADQASIAGEARRIVEEGRRTPGHVFNLGHGVLPDTDPDVLTRLVELVHGLTP
jgi:uroporphyrinogen decarboxylase